MRAEKAEKTRKADQKEADRRLRFAQAPQKFLAAMRAAVNPGCVTMKIAEGIYGQSGGRTVQCWQVGTEEKSHGSSSGYYPPDTTEPYYMGTDGRFYSACSVRTKKLFGRSAWESGVEEESLSYSRSTVTLESYQKALDEAGLKVRL